MQSVKSAYRQQSMSDPGLSFQSLYPHTNVSRAVLRRTASQLYGDVFSIKMHQHRAFGLSSGNTTCSPIKKLCTAMQSVDRQQWPADICHISLSGIIGMQAFKQRLYNFCQFLLIKAIVMGAGSRSAETKLARQFGYEAHASMARLSTSPAVIVGSDWALEYPFSLPPKVHVGSPLP